VFNSGGSTFVFYQSSVSSLFMAVCASALECAHLYSQSCVNNDGGIIDFFLCLAVSLAGNVTSMDESKNVGRPFDYLHLCCAFLCATICS
jgi:hypothetical protein